MESAFRTAGITRKSPHPNDRCSEIAPSASIFAQIGTAANDRSDWLVLEIGGEAQDIRAAPPHGPQAETRPHGRCRQDRTRGDIPALVSGYNRDGAAIREDHVTVVPLSSARFPHTDGRLMGLALMPPRGVSLAGIPFLADAFAPIATFEPARETRVFELSPASTAIRFWLVPERADAPRSLSPAPYLGTAVVCGTVTPMGLDRHLKGCGRAEIRP